MEADHKEIAKKVLTILSKWKPYIYHHATTGSIYIKFPHWGLGSIRIGDHRGLVKYAYRWYVRTDLPPHHVGKEQVKWTVRWSFGTDRLEKLKEKFEEAANDRGIVPGQRERWDQYIEKSSKTTGRSNAC